MALRNTPIRRKLMAIILLICGAVLLLTCGAFFAYEVVTFRQTTLQQLTTLGEIIAANSTAALGFDNQDDAREILASLKAEPHIVAASLYDKQGKLFAKFPEHLPADDFPTAPESDGYQVGRSHLAGFQPIVQGEKRLGTLYIKSDMGAMYERVRLYAGIVVLVIGASLLLAYTLSRILQEQISQPILALAETARAVSDRRDYSVRAVKVSEDEVGLLTGAFNHMLTQIQEQTHALRESEGRVRAVLNSALSAVLVIDAAGRITDWNARAEGMFGWPRSDALGRNLAETIIPPRYREAHRRGLEHFLATGEGPVLNRVIELSSLRRDGSEFPVELSISPIKGGDAPTFCGFITDITERKQAEDALRESEKRLRTVIDLVPHFIFAKDRDGRFLFANRAFAESFRLTPEQLAGRLDTELVPDRAQYEAFRRDDLDVIESGTAKFIPTERRTDLAGRTHIMQTTKIPFAAPGTAGPAVLGVAVDITERQQAHEVAERFAAIVESSDDAIISKTLDGTIISWNPGAERIFGYAANEAVGRSMVILSPPERVDEEAGILARIAKGERIVHLETVRVRKDGTRIDISSSISPIKDATGQIVGAATIARDITARRRAEEEIRQLNAELEQRVVRRTAALEAANKELEAFSYSVSHDLRTPLRAMDGFSQAVLEDCGPQLPPEGRRYLQAVRNGAQQMGVLIDDLLAFSRLSRLPVSKREVDPGQLVRDALDALKFLRHDRQVEIRIGELPSCHGDPALLKQVWLNLLSNALKYTRPRNPALVEIGCARESGENVYFVRDNGTGFDMQYAHKLFGVFQRLHRAEDYEGTGVGLATVQRIIHRHGGRVWAEAAVNRGATFFFTVEGETRS